MDKLEPKSRHKAPYCWAKNNYSQNELHDIGTIVCPGCHRDIGNADVTEGTQLINYVSLIRVLTHNNDQLFRENI